MKIDNKAITDARILKRYLARIGRRLRLPFEIRNRVMDDLSSDIYARREKGGNMSDILESMGTPSHVANSLNKEMAHLCYRRSPWRYLFLAASLLSLLWCLVLLTGLPSYVITPNEAVSIGIIGGADGPTSILVTSAPRSLGVKLLVSMLVMALGITGFFFLSRLKPRK